MCQALRAPGSKLTVAPGKDAARPDRAYSCINLRLMTRGGLYAWEFEKSRHVLNVRVEGRLTFNSSREVIEAAHAGFGLGCLPEDMVSAYLDDGSLQRVLGDWCPPFPGFHLYYPSRRQPSPAFSLLADALRARVKR